MKRKILKILAILFMFSVSVPVFADEKETKVESNVKETFKKRYVYEWLTNENYLKEMDTTTKRVINDFVAREIRRNDESSEKLKKYLKKEGIFSRKKIAENFEKILREIEKIKAKRIDALKEKLSKFENQIKTDKFKKEYTEYKLSQADSWRMCGASSKAIKYVEKDVMKKYKKKFEEMTQEEKIKYNEELNKTADKIDEKLKKKFKKEAKEEADDMQKNAKKFSGKHFEDYVDFRKKELERELEYEGGDLKYLKKILENKNKMKTAKDIFVKIDRSLPEDQKENFDFKKMVDIPKTKKLKTKKLN